MGLLTPHERRRILDLIDKFQAQVVIDSRLFHRTGILLSQIALGVPLGMLILHFRLILSLVNDCLILEMSLKFL